MVTNRSVLTAACGSAREALAAVDATLAQCEESRLSLEGRGKAHLHAYKSLTERIEQLKQRRRAIADVARA